MRVNRNRVSAVQVDAAAAKHAKQIVNRAIDSELRRMGHSRLPGRDREPPPAVTTNSIIAANDGTTYRAMPDGSLRRRDVKLSKKERRQWKRARRRERRQSAEEAKTQQLITVLDDIRKDGKP